MQDLYKFDKSKIIFGINYAYVFRLGTVMMRLNCSRFSGFGLPQPVNLALGFIALATHTLYRA
jgi:hypothetical protein